MTALAALTPTEVNALAAQVLMDRLTGFKVTGSDDKGRVSIGRVLAPTEAELRWDAMLAEIRPPSPPRETFTVHPGVVAVARAFKAQRNGHN